MILQGESSDSTILDAERQGGVIRISDNSYNMVSGLTLRGGQSGSGGGIYMSNTSPIIKNVNITDNYAVYGRSGFGGGIHCRNGSPVLQNIIITDNNSTVYGGGCYFSNSHPILINALILNNYYTGITCNSSTPFIINSTLLKQQTFSLAKVIHGGMKWLCGIINNIWKVMLEINRRQINT